MRNANAAKEFKDGQAAVKRPDGVTDEHLTYLDDLRDSGITNMFGARPYLMAEFDGLSDEQAATILGYWMKSFGNPKR